MWSVIDSRDNTVVESTTSIARATYVASQDEARFIQAHLTARTLDDTAGPDPDPKDWPDPDDADAAADDYEDHFWGRSE